MPVRAKLFEPALEDKQIDCVELYLPKRLKHLSELYQFLREKLVTRIAKDVHELVVSGFSIYEVDGAFRGQRDEPWEERSLVIRLLFHRPADAPEVSVQAKIKALGRDVAAIAHSEEEIWICYYPQRVSIFRPALHLPA